MKTYTEQVVENITGFEAWMKHWGDWHKGLKGKPDCRFCQGEGVVSVPNGEEDFDLEMCECHKNYGK